MKDEEATPPEHVIPPIILKEAAETVYDAVKPAYDRFTPSHMEWVRSLCAKQHPAAHSIPIWTIKQQIVDMRKKPHGDPLRLKQDKKKQKKVKRWNTPLVKDCAKRIKEPDWAGLSERCQERDGRNCRCCPDKSSQSHHRDYGSMRTPQEIDDLSALCDFCHMVITVRLRYPKEMEEFVKKMMKKHEENGDAIN